MQAEQRQQATNRSSSPLLDLPERAEAATRKPDESARQQSNEIRAMVSEEGPVQLSADDATKTPAQAQANELRTVVADGEGAVQAKEAPEQESDSQTESESDSDKGAAKKANYEKTLKSLYSDQFGGKLGPLLYDALKSAVSESALDGYAKDGVEAGVKELLKMLQESEEGSPDLEAFKKKIEGNWSKLAKDTATQMIDGIPELDKVFAAVSKWVREHPRTVVVAALMSAVLAKVLVHVIDDFDIDIPEIGGKFKAGKGVDIGVKVDVGTLKNLCLDSIQASLDLHNKNHKFSVETKLDKNDEKEGEETYSFTIIGKGENTLLEKIEKQNDASTEALKAEYATRLHQKWGTTLKLDDWKLTDLDLLYRLTLDFSQKNYDSTALDGLKQSAVWSKAQSLFLDYSSHTDVDSNEAQHNLKFGLSLSSGHTTETETDGVLTRSTYQQKLDQEFGMSLKLDDWSAKELSLLYRASLTLSKKDFESREVNDLKTSTAWEKSLKLFSEIQATSAIDENSFEPKSVNLKLGISFLLKRQVTFDRTLSNGKKITTRKSPLEFSFDAGVTSGYDFMNHMPETRATVGFTIRF